MNDRPCTSTSLLLHDGADAAEGKTIDLAIYLICGVHYIE